MSAAPPILTLERLTLGYGDAPPVIQDLTLALDPGEVVAVTSLDTSGGKSTLFRAAAGLLPPLAGRVRFRGEDVYALDAEAEQRYRSACAAVFTGGALLQNRTVEENVALPLRYHGEAGGAELGRKVAALLKEVGFQDDPRAYPWQLGARARHLVGFARALARSPALVVVDDLLGSLELADIRRLFELIMERNRRDQTSWLLISELDPILFRVAERVAVLEGGRLLACGSRGEVFKNAHVAQVFTLAGRAAEIHRATRMARISRLATPAGRLAEPEGGLETLDLQQVLPPAGRLAEPEGGLETLDLQQVLPPATPPELPPTRRVPPPDLPQAEWERRLLEELGGGPAGEAPPKPEVPPADAPDA